MTTRILMLAVGLISCSGGRDSNTPTLAPNPDAGDCIAVRNIKLNECVRDNQGAAITACQDKVAKEIDCTKKDGGQ